MKGWGRGVPLAQPTVLVIRLRLGLGESRRGLVKEVAQPLPRDHFEILLPGVLGWSW